MATRLSSRQSNKQGGDETKARIIAAALQTLRTDGIVGATARAIARNGDFNQALIFYHFGSVTELLVAAAKWEGRSRSERYAPRLVGVTTLADLVAVAKELHTEEVADGGLNVLTQLIAGAASSDELRAGLMASFEPWMQLVEASVERVLSDTRYAGIVPASSLSYAITSLFLGVELMHTLDPDNDVADQMFTTFGALAQVIEALLQTPPG